MYRPQDSMSVWWLAEPQRPRLIGAISLERGLDPAFSYAPSWVSSREALRLSEDMPLSAPKVVSSQRDSAPGAIDDARPDRWGERIIARFDNPRRLSVLEYLYFAGDDRMGALGISLSMTEYQPAVRPAIPHLGEIDQVSEAVKAVMDGGREDPRVYRLLAPGASLGGARPKALIDIEGRSWIAKFSENGDEFCSPSVEHAAMGLARVAGIDACSTRLIELPKARAVAIERFDRVGSERRHVISAKTALAAAGQPESYPDMALLMRRLGLAADRAANGEEMFKRMVFNILIDNTDDHHKNHAFYFDGVNVRLTPAFDVLPIGTGLKYQQMGVGDAGHESTLDNAVSRVREFGIEADRAMELMAQVSAAVDGWRMHFEQSGVHQVDIEYLARFIDSNEMVVQRKRAMDGDIKAPAVERARKKAQRP